MLRDVGWDGLLDLLLLARFARVVDIYEEGVLEMSQFVHLEWSCTVVWHSMWFTHLIAARFFALVFRHLAAQHLVGSIFPHHCSHVCGAFLCLVGDKMDLLIRTARLMFVCWKE